MSFLHLTSKGFTYPIPSPEETKFRQILVAAILEFGEPHAFETGAMTRPLLQDKKGRIIINTPAKSASSLEYYMLQEDGLGYTIFGAMRTTYNKETQVEPVRFAVQFVTVNGTAVLDVAVPSRYVLHEKRARSYEEKIGPRLRVNVLTRVKGQDLRRSF